MRTFIAGLAFVFSFSTFAADTKTVVCKKSAEGAAITATFTNIGSQNMKVRLFVPKRETSGSYYDGSCERNEGAIEASFSCNILTSTDSGFEIALFSIGGPSLTSIVQSWNMVGKGPEEILSCKTQR